MPGTRVQRPPSRRGRSIALWLLLIVLILGGTLGSWLVLRRSVGSRSELPSPLTSGSAAGFNIVVITLDTTRADHLGCYGRQYAETPALDTLAREGMLLADAVTVAPATLPAHASILTGLYPFNHGVRRDMEHPVATEHTTLAEVLRGEGYETVAFVGAFTLDARFGLDQGFDLYDGVINPAKLQPLSQTPDERKAGEVTDVALDWLHTRESGRPFFAWVHYVDPRQPFDPPEPYRTRFGDHAYDAEIAYVDSQIGRLVGSLRELNLAYETLVVVVGDHGEGLAEHGESAHDFFIYDSVMRVPMIVWCPGVFNGPYVIDDTVASVIDVFPTVLGLLGIAETPAVDGSSVIGDEPDPARAVYMESLAPYLEFGWSPLFGLRRHGDKFIRAPTSEYYDLVADPRELENLAAELSVDALRDELDTILSGRWPPDGVDEIGLSDPKEMLDSLYRFESARSLIEGGKLREGLFEMEEIIAASPGNRTALAEAAQVYWMMGALPDAERTLRAAIEIGPTPETLTTLAEVLVMYQRFGEVEDLAKRALAIDPHHGMAYLVLGDLAKQQKRFDEAKAFYDRAKEVDPHRLGLAHGRRAAALDRHLRALEVAKQRP